MVTVFYPALAASIFIILVGIALLVRSLMADKDLVMDVDEKDLEDDLEGLSWDCNNPSKPAYKPGRPRWPHNWPIRNKYVRNPD